MQTVDEIRVEYVNFEEIEKWPRNPKDHDLHEIRKSFKRFGFIKPVLVDEGTGKLVAGHGRIDTLRVIKDRGEEPPRGVKVDEDDRWLLPVLRGVKFDNYNEAEAFLMADNRLSEIGGWNKDLLAEMLAEIVDIDGALDGIGFDIADAMALIGEDPEDTLKEIPIQHNKSLVELVPPDEDLELLKGKKILVEFSGGKDSSAATIWCKHFLPDNEVELLFVDMGADYYGLTTFLKRLATAIGFPLVILRSKEAMIDRFLRKQEWPGWMGMTCHKVLHQALDDYMKQHNPDKIVVVRGGRRLERSKRSKVVRTTRWLTIDRMKEYKYYQPLYFTDKATSERVLQESGYPIWEGYSKGLMRTSCRICPGQTPRAYAALRSNFPDVWAELMELERILGKGAWRQGKIKKIGRKASFTELADLGMEQIANDEPEPEVKLDSEPNVEEEENNE